MKINEAIKEYKNIQSGYNKATRAASCKLSQNMNWYNTYISLRDLRNDINDNTRKSAKKAELLEAIDNMKEHISGLFSKYIGLDIRHEIFKAENQEQHAANFEARAKEERDEINRVIDANINTWNQLKPTIKELESGNLDGNLIKLIKGLGVSLSIDEHGHYFFNKDGHFKHLNNMIIKPHFLTEIKAFLFKCCVEPISAQKLEIEAEEAYYEYWQYETDYWTERD